MNSSIWLIVRETDLKTGNSKANVKIPANLADFRMKIAAKFMPGGVEGLNMNVIMAAVKSGGEEKLVDVFDEEKGEQVEIFVELDSLKSLQSFAHQDPVVFSSRVI
jgi:hypothetical protein